MADVGRKGFGGLSVEDGALVAVATGAVGGIQQQSGLGFALIAAGAGALALYAFVVAILWLAAASLPGRARAALPILRV